jgi:hypothetical protein
MRTCTLAIYQTPRFKMLSPESGGANLNQARRIQLSLVPPMGKSDSWLLILNWLLLMLAVTQTESLPTRHTCHHPNLLFRQPYIITLHTLTLKPVGKMFQGYRVHM